MRRRRLRSARTSKSAGAESKSPDQKQNGLTEEPFLFMFEQEIWSPEKFKRFKVEYAKAVLKSQRTFAFDGRTFQTKFAKYLVQYLEAPKKKNEKTD